jgi:hypothetical protein
MGEPDAVTWHQLERAINRQLDDYGVQVQECKALESALCFARFVRNSGLVKLLKFHASDGPLPCDGALTEFKASQLEHAVTERYRLGDSAPHVEMCELQAINRKLDLLAGQIAYVLPVAKVDVSAPPLRIIEGGLNESS